MVPVLHISRGKKENAREKVLFKASITLLEKRITQENTRLFSFIT